MKIGRNDPCPCGSGKKYKQCHGPIDAERESAQRRRRQAPDTLLPKIMDALDRFGAEMPAALAFFWNGTYNVQNVDELDQLEDRGSERFLTWFAFDSLDDEARTPVQRLLADPAELDLTEAEAEVFAGWADVHLQPYEVTAIKKGFGLEIHPMFGEGTIELEDHKASRRVEVGDVLIAHVIPAGDRHYVAGAAAHLTPDTLAQLDEFTAMHLADLQRARPEATRADLVRTRSYIFNHFVMALPREPQEASKLDEFVARTRATLNITAEQLGFGNTTTEALDAVDAVDGGEDEDAADEIVTTTTRTQHYDGTED